MGLQSSQPLISVLAPKWLRIGDLAGIPVRLLGAGEMELLRRVRWVPAFGRQKGVKGKGLTGLRLTARFIKKNGGFGY